MNKPIAEFTGGHTFRVSPQFDTSSEEGEGEGEEESYLQMTVEPDEGRDLFVIENYYTHLLIFVEFEDFSEGTYLGDKTRHLYNRSSSKP